MNATVPAELDPGDGHPVLAYGPFVVELAAGHSIGLRLAYQREQTDPDSLRWDDADTGGRAHSLVDADWVAMGPTLVSAQANGGTPALIRPVAEPDLAGTSYEGLPLPDAVAQLRADNRWAWAP